MSKRAPVLVALLMTVGVLLLVLASSAGTSAVGFGEAWKMRYESGPEVTDDGCTPEEQRMEPPPQECEYLPETPPLVRSVVAVGLGMVVLVIGMLLAFALVTAIISIRFQLRKRRRLAGILLDDVDQDPVDDPTQAQRAKVRTAARQALEELRRRQGGDPGDAVIAAWLVLEAAAAEAGSVRQAYQTPTEFTDAVLDRHELDTAALARLRTLYQRARFGSSPVTADDVAAAASALETLVDELSGSPA
jgi:hypothetical protein